MGGLYTIHEGQRISSFPQVLNIMMLHHTPPLIVLLSEPLASLPFPENSSYPGGAIAGFHREMYALRWCLTSVFVFCCCD